MARQGKAICCAAAHQQHYAGGAIGHRRPRPPHQPGGVPADNAAHSRQILLTPAALLQLHRLADVGVQSGLHKRGKTAGDKGGGCEDAYALYSCWALALAATEHATASTKTGQMGAACTTTNKQTKRSAWTPFECYGSHQQQEAQQGQHAWQHSRRPEAHSAQSGLSAQRLQGGAKARQATNIGRVGRRKVEGGVAAQQQVQGAAQDALQGQQHPTQLSDYQLAKAK